MADKSPTPEVAPAVPAASPTPPTVPPKRSPGHRGADVKDTVAEMTAKAHEISLEAGSKMAAAMKDVINAAAGITGFVLESARDLVQYMVRRGQMTQDEADKLILQAEQAQVGRPVVHRPPPTPAPVVHAAPSAPVPAASPAAPVAHHAPAAHEPAKPAPKAPVVKAAPAAKAPAAKPAPKATTPAKVVKSAKPVKKTAARTAHTEKPAKKAAAKTPAKKAPAKRK